MSIATQITALQNDKTAIASAITAKGGTVASGDGFDDFATDNGTISVANDPLQYATRIQYNFENLSQADCPDEIILNLPRVRYFTYGPALLAQPKRLIMHLSEDPICTSMTGACRWGCGITSSSRQLTYIKITGNLSAVTTYLNCFCDTSDGNYLEIDADLDFTSCTNVNGMFSSWDIIKVRFVANTLKISLDMVRCRSLYDSALVSIANGLNETVTDKTITIHAISKAKFSTIVGTVSMDSTNTYHIFTEDVSGSVTLADFVTNTKGWTLA